MTGVHTEPAEPGPEITTQATGPEPSLPDTAVAGDAARVDATASKPTFGRDRIVAFVAVFLFAMSSFPLFAWITGPAKMLPQAPDLLDATRLPATFPFVEAATNRGGSAPAMAWIPISLVVGVLIVAAFGTMVRRIGYLVFGIAAMTVTVFFVLALSEVLAQAGRNDLWAAHVGPGSVMFVVGGLLLIAAAIVVPRRKRTTEIDAGSIGPHDVAVTGTVTTTTTADSYADFARPDAGDDRRGAHDHPDSRPVIDTGDAPGKRSQPPESAGHSD